MTDLWNEIVSGSFAKKVKKAGRNRKRGKKEVSDSILRSLGIEVRVIKSPWRTIAVILPISRVTCKCGSVHHSACGPLLTRFQHRKDLSIQEVEHCGEQNSNLPRTCRYLDTFVSHCQDCWEVHSPPSPQFDLFTIYARQAPERQYPPDATPSSIMHPRNDSTIREYSDIIHPFFAMILHEGRNALTDARSHSHINLPTGDPK